jgi:hypothetical protein
VTGCCLSFGCMCGPLLQQPAEFLAEKMTRQTDVRQDGQPEVPTNLKKL